MEKLPLSIYLIVLFIIGTIFHLLFGYSMFDIYYKFPLSYGMPQYSPFLPLDENLSKRIAFVLLDGVRPEAFFEALSSGKMPFLRNVVEKRGMYGISHNYAPTETLPCVSALFKGVFENGALSLKRLYHIPYDIDSIYNQSNYVWGIGSFACMETNECIPFDDGSKSPEERSYLIFKANHDYLKNGTNNPNLKKERIMFIYQFSMTDLIGHEYGPTGERAINHYIGMDKYFKQLEQDFYDYYKDNKTTFIITSDHGMGDDRIHGDKNILNRKMPLVIWGAGIRNAIHRKKKPKNEDTPKNWKLDNILRRDIYEIDMTPLISGLFGINFPINSLGVIPIDILNATDKVKSKILFANTMEIYENYRVKNYMKKKSIIYKEYKTLINSENIINDIKRDFENNNYLEAMNKSKKVIDLSLEGINYLLHYDQLYLKIIIGLGYILWIPYLLIFVEMKNNNILNEFFINFKNKKIITLFSGIITLLFIIYLYLSLSPIIYYFYTLFTCYFSWIIFCNFKYLLSFFKSDNNSFGKKIIYYILAFLLFLSLVS